MLNGLASAQTKHMVYGEQPETSEEQLKRF